MPTRANATTAMSGSCVKPDWLIASAHVGQINNEASRPIPLRDQVITPVRSRVQPVAPSRHTAQGFGGVNRSLKKPIQVLTVPIERVKGSCTAPSSNGEPPSLGTCGARQCSSKMSRLEDHSSCVVSAAAQLAWGRPPHIGRIHKARSIMWCRRSVGANSAARPSCPGQEPSGTSLCRPAQLTPLSGNPSAIGSRKFVVDLPANRLGPGWRQKMG